MSDLSHSMHDHLSSDGYAFIIQPVQKPVKGLYITVYTDKERTKYTHRIAQALQPTDMICSFHHKKNIEKIQTHSCPVRWLARGKHLPRITIALDRDGDASVENICRRSLCEYMIVKKQHNETDDHFSYTCSHISNMLYNADLTILHESHTDAHKTGQISYLDDSHSVHFQKSKTYATHVCDVMNKKHVGSLECKGVSYDKLLSFTDIPSIKVKCDNPTFLKVLPLVISSVLQS
jgi:hypothetical protein